MFKLASFLNTKTHAGIGRRLVLWILAFSSVVTLIFTGVQLAIEFRHDVSRIETNLDQIPISYADTLSHSLWITSQKDVTLQLHGISRLPNIQYLEVRNENDQIVATAGTPQNLRILRQDTPLYFNYLDQQIYVGQLSASASLEGAYQHLKDKVLVILLSQSIKTFLVSAFILVLFQMLVGRHLRKIAQYSEAIEAGSISQPLTLERRTAAEPHQDELDQLVHSLNTMNRRLSAAYQDLQQNKENIRLTVESVQDYAILRLDPLGFVASWNLGAERIFGYQSAEIIGKPNTLFFLPEDISSGRHEELLHKAAEQGRYEEEGFRIRKDGSIFTAVDLLTSLYDPQGRLIGYSKVTRDITERKQAEETLLKSEVRFRKLMEKLPLPLCHVDKAGAIIFRNERFIRIFGYTEDDVPTVSDWWQKAYPDPKYRHWVTTTWDDAVQRAAGQKKDIDPIEYRVTSKNGQERVMEISGITLEDELLATFTDLTERKHDEAEKAKLKSQLQQAQKMEAIGTLAGGIAHDFNNILAVMLGYTEMVREDMPEDSKFASDLEKVLESGYRAKELVKQILAFSRQAQVERLPIQLQPVVNEVLKMLRSSIPSSIPIHADIDSECGVVLADPTQVHQIMVNLCTNASHAMEDTGGILQIQLKSIHIDNETELGPLTLEPGQYAELIISDTGCGIGPDIIDKIFDPYFTTKGQGKGTGMGLAIIHGIITSYNGGITVESTLGKGTTFHVYFPVVAQEEMATVKEVETIPLGCDRVLFVDDEELLAEMGKDMLERLGYQVTTRRSSLEALATFQNNPDGFDVIITDQTMPGMTGSDLSQRLLQIRPDIPIILCTGYSNLIDEDSSKALGIKEFALKPLTKQVIAKLIRKVLA